MSVGFFIGVIFLRSYYGKLCIIPFQCEVSVKVMVASLAFGRKLLSLDNEKSMLAFFSGVCQW